MSFDLGSQNLLIAVILAVIALGVALLGCRLLGGKAFHVRISALILMLLVSLPLFLIRSLMALDYYGLLFTETIIAFTIPVCCLMMACSNWMEWLSPPPQWKMRAYRERSILSGIGLTVAGISLAVFFLVHATADLSDMGIGPSFGVGTIAQLTLNHSRGVVTGGEFVVDGVPYSTPNLHWYNTLSIGQSLEFAYGLNSHYGFPADQVILSPLGIAFPALMVGAILLFFSAGYHFLKPSSGPTDQVSSKERNPFEQLADSVAKYRETKGMGPFILLMILPLLLFGMILLILTSK